MPNRNHQDQKLAVSYLADNAIIGHTIAPKSRQIMTQCFAETAWVFLSGYAPIKVANNLFLRCSIELAQFFQGALIDPIDPVHVSLP